MKRREGTTSVVRIPPQRGEGRLAGGERSEPPDRRGITICTPAGVAGAPRAPPGARWSCRHGFRSEEHTSELQSHSDLVCRLLLEKKKKDHQPRARKGAATTAGRAPPGDPGQCSGTPRAASGGHG